MRVLNNERHPQYAGYIAQRQAILNKIAKLETTDAAKKVADRRRSSPQGGRHGVESKAKAQVGAPGRHFGCGDPRHRSASFRRVRTRGSARRAIERKLRA